MASPAGDIGVPGDKVEEKVPAPPKLAEVKTATVEEVDDLDDVPDPDEDDLDDLDDLLDEFSAAKIEPKQPQVSPDQGRPATAAPAEPALEDAFSDDEFAKQLQAGMAELLGDMETSPEIQAQFENIFKELGAAAVETSDSPLREAPLADSTARSVPPSATGAPETSASAEAAEASFQETIKRTMERMQASGEQATAAAAAEGTDDFLAEMLKQMGGGAGLDAGGEGNEEEFSKMLLGMMEQLTNKEILYEPMKELDEKFPDWLVKNKDQTTKEDLKRYELQQGLVKEIVIKFEEKTYSDSNKADREYIVERMQKMQAAGSPPPDLVGDMPSTQDVMSMPDESCNPQ
ncbi:Pex19 protein family-domain-containing protein [Schizothecium vesticola]|uniref:Pex19 protein family-domain-containing protein n=1 Tax=Schizothecium vesticola TaxID=314040 RepID=A0AA40FBF7_9PEZI|nr:Pex19 protein family-domain-containing protein [Schizothecium vesticola]